ncbi:MAG: hypothetical protein ACK55I_24030, partial [bacterium]
DAHRRRGQHAQPRGRTRAEAASQRHHARSRSHDHASDGRASHRECQHRKTHTKRELRRRVERRRDALGAKSPSSLPLATTRSRGHHALDASHGDETRRRAPAQRGFGRVALGLGALGLRDLAQTKSHL